MNNNEPKATIVLFVYISYTMQPFTSTDTNKLSDVAHVLAACKFEFYHVFV